MTKETLKKLINNEIDNSHININIILSLISQYRKAYASRIKSDKASSMPEEYERVVFASASVCNVDTSNLTYPQNGDTVMARSLIYSYLRNEGFTYERIASVFDKNHATIIHSIRSLRTLYAIKDKLLTTRVNNLKKIIPHYEI